MAMSDEQLERLITGFAEGLAQSISNNNDANLARANNDRQAADARAALAREEARTSAAADREALVSSLNALVRTSNPSGGMRHKRHDDNKDTKVDDLSSNIVKAQRAAADWVVDNTFNPDDTKAELWLHELKCQFTSPFCGLVMDLAGWEMCRRQSNDLYEYVLKHEKEYVRMGNQVAEHGGSNSEKHLYADDVITTYFAGEPQPIGRLAMRFRKLLMRQALGFQYTHVLAEYDLECLEQAYYSAGGVWRFNENSSWYQALFLIIQTGTDTKDERVSVSSIRPDPGDAYDSDEFETVTAPPRPATDSDADEAEKAAAYSEDDTPQFTKRPRSARDGRPSIRVTDANTEKELAKRDGRPIRTSLQILQDDGIHRYHRMSRASKLRLWDVFHSMYPDIALPVTFEPQYFIQNLDNSDPLLEPLQVPVLPTTDVITIRHKGKLMTGFAFVLRRITAHTPLHYLVPVLDKRGHEYVAADDAARKRYVRGFPVKAQYDDQDRTGQFSAARAMSHTMWHAMDKAVFDIIKKGVDQRSVEKADLVSWEAICKIDTTICDHASYLACRILIDSHYEPDDAWIDTLKDWILDHRLVYEVKIGYFINAMERGKRLLDNALGGRSHDSINQKTLFEKLETQIIRLYKGEPTAKDDALTRGYRKLVEVHKNRYDIITHPPWDEDTQPRKRNAPFHRDWSSYDKLKAAVDRVEKNNPECVRISYYPEYDIESRQPKGKRTSVHHAKMLYDADGHSFTVSEAVDALEDELALTLEHPDASTLERSLADINDELMSLSTTMPFTPRPHVPRVSSQSPKSLAGGPGGPRRFASARGQHGLSRANQPYLGIHPAATGGGGKKPPMPPKAPSDRFKNAATKAIHRSKTPPPARSVGFSSDRGSSRGSRDSSPASSLTSSGPRNDTNLISKLRRKTELVLTRIDASERAIKNKDFDRVAAELSRMKTFVNEMMLGDAGSDGTEHTEADGFSFGAKTDDVDSAHDDSDEEAVQAMTALIQDSSADAESRLMKIATLFDHKDSALVLTLDDVALVEHDWLSSSLLAAPLKRHILLLDSCATRPMHPDDMFFAWSKTLTNPIPVNQGSEPTPATKIGIAVVCLTVDGQKTARVKTDLALMCPKFRKGIRIEGLRPALKRGARIGGQVNYLYHRDHASPIRASDGLVADSWDDCTTEFQHSAVPAFELSNGLPYVHISTLQDTIDAGYELVDFYTGEKYDHAAAIRNLKNSMKFHREQEYYAQACTMVDDAMLTPSTLSNVDMLAARCDIEDDLSDYFDAVERADEMPHYYDPNNLEFEDVLRLANSGKSVDSLFEQQDVFYEAQSQTSATPDTRERHRKRPFTPPYRKGARRMPTAGKIREMAGTAVFTLIALCYGASTESTFQLCSGGTDCLPYKVIGGCEKEPALRKHFAHLNPHLPAHMNHDDMVRLCDELKSGAIDTDAWHADICIVSTPCINKTALKDYNQAAYNPDDKLFELQACFVELTRPKIVISEMTAPHDLCHEDHKLVAERFRQMTPSYHVTVTDRLPTDLCGDRTHRDRWFMVAELYSPCKFNIADWADKQCSPAYTILDDIADVDPALWIDAEIEEWDSYRMGNKKRLADITPADVGQFVTHAYRFGHLKGYNSEKGTKVIDVWKGPIPTTTRFANDIIVDKRRIGSGPKLRLMSMSEYARAASFSEEQIRWLRTLDPMMTEHEGGPLAFQVIAGAIPRNTLHTMLRICCYRLCLADSVTAAYLSQTESPSHAPSMIHCFDIPDDLVETANLLDEPQLALDAECSKPGTDDELARLYRHRHFTQLMPENHKFLPALFLVHCTQCLCDKRAFYTHSDSESVELLMQDGSLQHAPDDAYAAIGPDEVATQRSNGDLVLRAPAERDRLKSANKRFVMWPAFIQDPDSPERRNAVDRAMRYHEIFHHSPAKMEKNIALGMNYGCKPGDSRYLIQCPKCLGAGIDKVPRDHKSKVPSTRDVTDLPGEKWLLDGNDTTVYSEWGGYRYCLHFVDSVSYFRISYPTRTCSAAEFLDALRYVCNFTQMQTGRKIKSLYTDQQSAFISERATDFMAHKGIKLEVVPEGMHHLNGIAEECVHSQTRMTRVRCHALKGFPIKDTPIASPTRWWPLANEHATQSHNFSSYSTLERKHGHPMSPWQAFTGSNVLPPACLHAFGEPCYVLVKKEKRSSKLEDTAELCRYLHNASFNPISNVMADCPRAHVCLRKNGQVCVSAKVVFVTKNFSITKEGARPDLVQPAADTFARAAQTLDNTNESEELRIQRFLSSLKRTDAPSKHRVGGGSRHTAPTSARTAALSRVPGSGASPTDPVGEPSPDHVVPAVPPPEPPPIPTPLTQVTRPIGDSTVELAPVLTMPKADYFKDKEVRIRWDTAKAKRPGTISGSEYERYSKSATTKQWYDLGGGLFSKHFDNDMRKGLFRFMDSPHRELQDAVMRDHVTERAAQRTRIRDQVMALAQRSANPGGDTHTKRHSSLSGGATSLTKAIDSLPLDVLDDFDTVLMTANAELLRMEANTDADPMQTYRAVREAYSDNFGFKASHARDTNYERLDPEYSAQAFECFHADSYAATHDVNEELQDQLLFALTDDNVTEFVIQCVDDRPVTETALLSAPTRKNDTNFDGKVLEPRDIVIDEMRLQGLQEYTGEKRAGMAKAVAKELHDLCSLGTFCWCKLPTGRKAISSRLVLKIKYKADGSFDKFKGRLVARGFEARPGIDFFGTFAPMANLTTVRTLFALAVFHQLPIIHSDIPNAFLQSKIDVEQYIMFPKGVTVDSKCVYDNVDSSSWDNRVVKLLRSIYGLKSSPQLFNKLLNEFLEKDLKLTRASSDTCLYYSNTEDGFVLLATEVDDLVITGNDSKKLQEIRSLLETKFKMKDWDNPIKSFLGINIDYDMANSRLSMDVNDKVAKLFNEKHTTLKSVRPRKTPLPPKEPISMSSDSEKVLERHYTRVQQYIADNYASIVGALIYMSITCRPDISFAIGRVSRGMQAPTYTHVKMLEHLCGYMRNFPHLKLTYQRSGSPIYSHLQHLSEKDTALSSLCYLDYRGDRHTQEQRDLNGDPMFGMTDSDYANTTEERRRSISGYCFFVYGCLVNWKSKLQPLTAASTHEAELIAMSFAADEAIWLRRLLLEVGFSVPAVWHMRHNEADDDPTEFADRATEKWITKMRPTWLLGDNQSAIFTANNPETSQRSKHLEIRWFRIRDYIQNLTLQVRHIPTLDNVADFFTKSLQGEEQFGRFRMHLMGTQDYDPKCK